MDPAKKGAALFGRTFKFSARNFLTSSGSFLTVMFARTALPSGSHSNLQTYTIERGLCCGHFQHSTYFMHRVSAGNVDIIILRELSINCFKTLHRVSWRNSDINLRRELSINCFNTLHRVSPSGGTRDIFRGMKRCRRCQDPRSHNDRKWSLKIFLNISNLRTHTPCSVQMTVAAPIYIIVIC